jgi:hypothetical protein
MSDATEHSEVIIYFVFKINAVRNQAQGQLQIVANPVANWTLRVQLADVIQYAVHTHSFSRRAFVVTSTNCGT